MHFAQSLLLCASLIASVSARIAFTTLPQTVKAGSPVRLAWAGGNGQPVTITLKQGSPNNLETVALITGDATGDSYIWTPSTSLPNASNYALQIDQSDTDPNFTGLFSLTGGSSSSSSATSSASSSARSSSSSSRVIVVSTGTGSTPTASGNGTLSVTATAQTTATSAVNIGTGVSGGTGASTGISTSRNATLSRPTLSRTSSSSSSSETASTTSGQGEQTETTSTTAPSSSSSGGAVTLASNFALLLAGFVAVAYAA